MQPDGGIVNEAAAARTARLEQELHQKLAELEETSHQAQALSSENAALREELGRSQERLHAVEQDSSATQVTDIHECALHVQSASEGPDRPAQSAFQSQSLSLSWLQYSGIQSVQAAVPSSG